MKRILVTGGAGFIGSNFIRYLLRAYPDAHVTNLDKLTYAGNLDNLKDLDASRHAFVRGDIGDLATVEQAIAGCDWVVNFAADSHVDRSIQGASEFLATNVTGVYNVVEAARRTGVSRVLLVSTDEVYGSREHGSFREEDAIGPRNPYSASKAAGEYVGMSYFHTFGLPVLITRGSNTYGPYQYPEKALPLFTTNAIDSEPLPLYGDGRNVRDWLFVEDHCRAIDCVLQHGTPGQIYNVSGGNERENIELTRRILDLTGRDESLIRPVPDRPGHDRRYAIDSAKARRELGWEPQTAFPEGLRLTVEWYRSHDGWWERIKSGAYREYYERMYGKNV